jgi:uncharacterized protein
MAVVSPGVGFVPSQLRVLDYLAYYRWVKAQLETAVATPGAATYPEPCERCDSCNWALTCAERRRADDHLSLVAGITRSQRTELVEQGVESLVALAKLPLPLQSSRAP